MQQRRVRLGDILDDYCPRERRITNHAVVAMIEDQVKQTRCTTCDADHEYKGAKAPSHRRRKAEGALVSDVESESHPELVAAGLSVQDDEGSLVDETEPGEAPGDPIGVSDDMDADGIAASTGIPASTTATRDVEAGDEETDGAEADPVADEADEWPVHRPLIRATLPRPEGQTPERKEPDFTMRSAGPRFDGNRTGRQNRGPRQQRQAQGPSGGYRQTGPGQQGERNGNRAPQPGQRSGRPGGPGGGSGGQNRGPRQAGQGRGPKRGR
jgi:hypothetical protein